MNLAVRLLYALNRSYQGLEWKEFTIRQGVEEIADACLDYEVIAFSCYIWNITQTLKVAEAIKKKNNQIKILLGGPEVSYDWQEVLTHPAIDFIITGEGEIPFSAFLNHYPNLSEVPNLAYKRAGEILYKEQAANIGMEQFEGVNPYVFEDPSDLKNKVSYIETSRGCPYKCEFCLASLDNRVRYLPMADIKDNLLYLMQHGRVIKFLDRTFNIKKDFTLEIFQFILDHHRPENVFQFEITADILHPDIISFIREKVPRGLFRFEIGIQTVNQKSNLEVSRKQNFNKTKDIIRQVESKVDLHLDLIVGLPLEYFSDVKYSFEEVFRLFPPELQLGFLKFLKGTPVRYKHEQYGYIFHPEAPYEIIESNFLSRDELHNIRLVEEALEIYWNKKRAIHVLMYITQTYSVFDFLMGLGNFFEKHSHFHRHDLKDVYMLLYKYSKIKYPEDKILFQLISLDYCLHHKIKPAPLFIEETDISIKNKMIESYQLNHHRFRYFFIPVIFNWKEWNLNKTVLPDEDILIIQYSGKDQPEIIPASSLRKDRIQ